MKVPSVNSPTNSVTFGYHHPLKTMWLKNNWFQKKVTHGIYGDVLTPSNVSLEHLQCFSQNGPTDFTNLALASMRRNTARGDAPLKDFLIPKKAIEYLLQFKDIKAEGFSGNKYIAGILETLKRLEVL